MTRISRYLLASAACGALLAPPGWAAQRVFVASYGNDVNAASGCLLASPCRGFAAALGAVDPGGEVVALDAAGYGTANITKSVTLTGNPGYFAGIAASSGNAVTIATPGVEVILRGLNINGVGAARGIDMTNGAQLFVENCVISNFTQYGVYVSAAADVRIVNTLVRGNGSNGIYLLDGVRAEIADSQVLDNGYVGVWADAEAGDVRLSVSDSIVSGNAWGIGVTGASAKATVMRSTTSNNASAGVEVESGALVAVGYTVATGNNVGFGNISATLESLGNNLVRGNTTNLSGTVTNVGGS